MENGAMTGFGKEIMRKEFLVDSNKTFLNQGSYGNAPRRVLEYRFRLIEQMEEMPDDWFRWKSEEIWLSNIQCVADFVGSDPGNLVFVSNATAGYNTVLRSLPFEKGDGILLNSWTYFSVKTTCSYIADTKNVELFYVDIPFPLKSVSQIIDAFEEQLSKHPNIKFVVVDYISSCPTALMPVKELITLCRKYDKIVFIDGAHTPGHITLNLEELGADFFAGNLHKWMFTPRSCAILWISPKFHRKIAPIVISRYDAEILHKNYFYQGTGDNTAYYCASEALKFYQEIGGHEKISAYCSKLVSEGANLLVKKWNTNVYPLPDEMLTPFMRLVRVPYLSKFHDTVSSKDGSVERIGNNELLSRTVWERFQVISAFTFTNDQIWCRISASVFNEIGDYEKLADAILMLLTEEQETVDMDVSR